LGGVNEKLSSTVIPSFDVVEATDALCKTEVLDRFLIGAGLNNSSVYTTLKIKRDHESHWSVVV
jgi:hypothetical protein